MKLMVLVLKKIKIISINWSLCLVVFVVGAACSSPTEKEFNLGTEEAEKSHFRIAVNHFENVVKRDPESVLSLKASREAARILFLEIKDFKKAVDFYKRIILVSPDPEERINAQRQIVAIHFDHLTDYKAAVVEINKLLLMLENPREKVEYKIKLARAYYYQNNFSQAKNETDEFLSGNPTQEQKFDMLLLKSNIALAEKDFPGGITILKTIMAEFPERAGKENIGLTLSVAFEEMKDFKSAIETLENLKKTHPMPEYIDIRIKRLQERLKNQPGARGKFRK